MSHLFAFRSSVDWHYIQTRFSANVGKQYKTIIKTPEFITFKNDYGNKTTIPKEEFHMIVFIKEVKNNDFNNKLDGLFDE